MKQHHITLRQRQRDALRKQGLVGRHIRAQKIELIHLIGLQLQPMRTRDEMQRAVVGIFRTQRQPYRNQVIALERPVADIAMPAGGGAKGRMLGHHAIVMGQRGAHRLGE